MQMLRNRYTCPEWSLVTEVGNNGSGSSRYADAIAVNTWSSRGYVIHGFELKHSRGDWLSELKQPGKSEPIMKLCDQWWLVCEAEIIKKGELPLGWGLLVPNSQRDTMRVKIQAPMLDHVPLTRAFVASLMRRAMQQSSSTECLDVQFQRGREAGRTDNTYDLKRIASDHDDLVKKVREFECASGLTIRYGYDMEKLGAIVKHIMVYGTPQEITERLLYTAKSTVKLLEEGMKHD